MDINQPSLPKRPHFIGIAGTGMSALARYMAFKGFEVTGSDRSFDSPSGTTSTTLNQLKKLNVSIHPQDGCGVTEKTDAVIFSTAVEKTNPDIVKAKTAKIPLLHRSELLAAITRQHQTIAVAGTSGKSTVTGMIYSILHSAGFDPSVINGAEILGHGQHDEPFNAYAGKGGWLVVEADESDGSLLRYNPEIGIVLNIDKDHQEIPELIELFGKFIHNSKSVLLNGSDPHCKNLAESKEQLFYTGTRQNPQGEVKITLSEKWKSEFVWKGQNFELNVPGLHNVYNAVAAFNVAEKIGISPEKCSEGIKAFKGIARRHNLVGIKNGITVIDDFAHNPVKIAACLQSVKPFARRIMAVFHPHGFGPMKLMGKEIAESMAENLGDGDLIVFPEIFYAGGTAQTDVSSKDLQKWANQIKPIAVFCNSKEDVLQKAKNWLRPGDWVVSMGARDPSLPEFAQKLAGIL